MELSPAAVEVRKDETARLYEALTDGGVVGDSAYETTGVLRMGRADLHDIRPGISLDYAYDPGGLDDW